jgi:hypothetical protein
MDLRPILNVWLSRMMELDQETPPQSVYISLSINLSMYSIQGILAIQAEELSESQLEQENQVDGIVTLNLAPKFRPSSGCAHVNRRHM